MGRSKAVRRTIGRDPFEAVIPSCGADEVAVAGGTEAPTPARPKRGRGRPRTIGAPPADRDRRVTAAPAGEGSPPAAVSPVDAAAPGRRKQKLTVHLDDELVNRVKNAAYWNPRLNIARIAERGIRRAVEEVERENGGPYEQRESELVGGRPIR